MKRATEKRSEKKRSKFVYKHRPPDATKARAEQSGGRFDSPFKPNVDTFRPKEGDNLIRILPPTWDGFEHYGYDVWLHKRVGPDNSTYLCPRKMLNKPCPICIEAKKAQDAGETEEARNLSANKSVVSWVLDRDNQEPTPMLYLQSWNMDREVSLLLRNARTGKVIEIDHPDAGYDLTINRRGRGIQTRYTFIVDRESSPISDDQDVQDQVLDYIEENPVPEQLHYYPYDYLEKIMQGTEEKRDEDLDDVETEEADEKPKRSKRAVAEEEEEERPRKRARKAEPEEEEEEEEEVKPRTRSRREEPEEDEDEEEEEEVKPRTRARKAEVEEEEEEEDEAPPPRRGRARKEEPEEEDEEEEEVAPKRGRTTRREEPEEEEEEDERPQRRRAGARR